MWPGSSWGAEPRLDNVAPYLVRSSPMTVHLYLAPVAAGKTAYVLATARAASQDLTTIPRIVVPNGLQARAARRRLAEMGGAMGVRIQTFGQLYREILDASESAYVDLTDPVQFRLLRATAKALPLEYYAPICSMPGFVQTMQKLIGELKAGCITPGAFNVAVRALGDQPRLRELALIYAAYQHHLDARNWTDQAGLAGLALDALRHAEVFSDCQYLAVDGFDTFTPVQYALLTALALRVRRLVVTLTGEPGASEPNLAHHRLVKTRIRLQAALETTAEQLPETVTAGGFALRKDLNSELSRLSERLFRLNPTPVDARGSVQLIEAPDRAGEVRAALRWLKARVLHDGYRPGQVVLIARHLAPYRLFVQQTAAEYGLPLCIVEGDSLRSNPAIAALFGLLQCALPIDKQGALALPRPQVVAAWRSPYFDWTARAGESRPQPPAQTLGITPADADALDVVALWARVLGGGNQWTEALQRLVSLAAREDAGRPASDADEERGLPANVPRGQAARDLAAKFSFFGNLIAPPAGAQSYRRFAGWLEDLIGDDAREGSSGSGDEPDDPAGASGTGEADGRCLQMVERCRLGDPQLADRDIAALAALKDVLRGLVWAEELIPSGREIDYATFLAELGAAVDAARYATQARVDREEILVVDAARARGLSFRAAALIGLAEGEFPATLREDPFLRDADRRRMREDSGLDVELSTGGAEAQLFVECVTRARDRLLVTRPRLADNGAPWQPSPYWDEVRRLLTVEPDRLTGDTVPAGDSAASLTELIESLATYGGPAELQRWLREVKPGRTKGVENAQQLLSERRSALASAALEGGASSDSPSPAPRLFDGDLTRYGEDFAARFAPEKAWSASRLETYRTCPFSFFMSRVLELEPRQEPIEGLDSRQLGNIYHHIFQSVYESASDPADLEQLLTILPGIATKELDEAPEREGFRETAWWQQTRSEIEASIHDSLSQLAALQSGYVPILHEAHFGGEQSLIVTDGEDWYCLHGFIDRVDRAPDGSLRIIDYKTAGPSTFTNKAIAEGKKLQVPLYAAAAETALGLGRVTDGFYWHVQHAEASSFKLASFEGGPGAAIETAKGHAWAAVRGARKGRFSPRPPAEGCPQFCPAASFCWHYRPRQ